MCDNLKAVFGIIQLYPDKFLLLYIIEDETWSTLWISPTEKAPKKDKLGLSSIVSDSFLGYTDYKPHRLSSSQEQSVANHKQVLKKSPTEHIRYGKNLLNGVKNYSLIRHIIQIQLPVDVDSMWIQQDGATCQTVRETIGLLH